MFTFPVFISSLIAALRSLILNLLFFRSWGEGVGFFFFLGFFLFLGGGGFWGRVFFFVVFPGRRCNSLLVVDLGGGEGKKGEKTLRISHSIRHRSLRSRARRELLGRPWKKKGKGGGGGREADSLMRNYEMRGFDSYLRSIRREEIEGRSCLSELAWAKSRDIDRLGWKEGGKKKRRTLAAMQTAWHLYLFRASVSAKGGGSLCFGLLVIKPSRYALSSAAVRKGRRGEEELGAICPLSEVVITLISRVRPSIYSTLRLSRFW